MFSISGSIERLASPARALGQIKRLWDKRSFDLVAEKVLVTAPLPQQGDSPLFLSLICHRDVPAYLLAIKSLYRRVGLGQVTVINDGSLTATDLDLLRHHIPGILVLQIADVATGSCPRGGCWERLVKIVELSNDHYVIQVDADTFVSGPIPEVIECWQNNSSFLLGTGSGRAVSPAPVTARMVRGWIEKNGWTKFSVGTEAEASLDRLPQAAQRSYVHASAGFAGFARGSFSMDDLSRFSSSMSELLGVQRWHEWGSEQIASNYLLANAPGAMVLPFPRYACFEPHLELGDHAFLHFLGAYRYKGGVYRQQAAEFIANY